ncbi:hypothetical protein HMPREF9004_1131 [Schaalia cardiffensis F0333]|uniref:Uncharacterized protein n=1 Tax=Schaalia cardiffensis F0333 TaxID=888050 RepID=N6W6F0_9ACTO|nr:hypothetical protein HMPREF9004_1131 [Schaalia cardiffensis F0333]
MGSSPLTRGALDTYADVVADNRLIPAHAGSTTRTTKAAARHPAHPRSRGEHTVMRWNIWDEVGSSPLTRGAPLAKGAVAHDAGLIPAHAGSTSGRPARSRCETAHPRSRGEHVSWALPCRIP